MRPLLTAFLFFILFIFKENNCQGQAGMWTCYKSGGTPVFGIQGVSDPLNNPPNVYEAVEWTDLQGNFWMYGGSDGNWHNWGDLWKYDPNTNMWTWIKGSGVLDDPGNYGTMGVPALSNRPISLAWGAQSWVNNVTGDLWMHGGYPAGSEMWRYNIATNTWTWMQGSGGVVYGTQGVPSPLNNPGYRQESSATWVDNAGNFWFFGGYGTSGVHNDLWKFDVNTNEWTWMKGSTGGNPTGNYGIMGVEDSTNVPSGRSAYSTWKDNAGNFWMFGGSMADVNSSIYYNDLWKYNVSTNNWIWMGGSSSINQNGNYGTNCIASQNYIPSARAETRSRWVDNNGNFWLFGGGRVSPFGSSLWNYDDLWCFNPTTLHWAYVNGSHTYNQASVIGTIGIPSPTNSPGAHFGSVGWKSLSGDLYLFGGYYRNDLWKFAIDTTCVGSSQNVIANFTANTVSFCDSACVNFTDSSTNNANGWLWKFPGATPDSSILQNPTGICYHTPGNYNVSLQITSPFGSDYIVKGAYISVLNCAPVVAGFTTSNTLYCDTACINFIDSSTNNPISWQWNFTGATPDTSTLKNPTGICYSTPGNYPVSLIVTNAYGTDTLTKTNYINIHTSPTATALTNDSVICAGSFGTLTAITNTGINYQWYVNGNIFNGAIDSTLLDSMGGNYYFITTDSLGCTATSNIVSTIVDPLPITCSLTIPFSNCVNVQLCSPLDSTYQYVWSTNAITPCININTSGTYTVTVTDINGCIGITDSLITLPAPTTYAINEPTACDSALLCTDPGYISYQWSTNDTTQCITVFASGAYNVTLLDSNFCTTIGRINIPVDTFNAVVTQTADTLFALPSDSSFIYTWMLNGAAYNSCDSSSFCLLTANGNYQVVIQNSNGCIDTSSILFVVNVSLFENNEFANFNVTSNHYTKDVTIEALLISDLRAEVSLYNPLGQIVYIQKWAMKRGMNKKQIHLNSLTKGIYFLNIKAKDVFLNKKIIVN